MIGAVAEDLLHVERDEEEHREERGADQEADHVGAGDGAHAEDREGDERRPRAQLDRDEGAEQDQPRRDQCRSSAPSPSRRCSASTQREDEGREAGVIVTAPATSKWRVSASDRGVSAISRGASAAAAMPIGTLTQSTHSQPSVFGEDAAEQHAGGAAGAGDRAPDPERFVALGAVAEGGGDDRERGGGEDRRAQALHRAGGDQLARVGGEAARQRGEREEDQPGHEDAAAAEQVGEPAAEQQEAAEGEHVGVHDPGQVVLGEVERFPDRRQRDVDDRGVEDDDELGDAEQGQRDPAFLGSLRTPSPQSSKRRARLRARSGRGESRSGPARPGPACRACASRWRGGSRPSSRRGAGSRRSVSSCSPRRRA